MWVGANFFELSFLAKAFFVFIAGLVTFLAPCTLPMVPGYISYLAGFSQNRKTIIRKSILFVLGFSFVFMLFGIFAGAAGSFLVGARSILSLIGGGIVIGFGIATLLNISIAPSWMSAGPIRAIEWVNRPGGAFVLGASLGFGWIPCIGLILGSVLTLAASSAHALEGGVLLAIFCVGMSVPFLAIALGIDRADRIIQKYPVASTISSVVGGIVLVGMGALLMTNSFGYFASWLFRVFSFLQYDALLQYL